MATRSTFIQPLEIRVRRTFSAEFRRKKVEEIECKISSVSEISREYQVTRTAVYKWIKQYSSSMKKKERLIVEAESDTRKLAILQQRIAELERLLGQKQIQLDFMEKVIDIAEETYHVDIKKKFGGNV
jgi:transposase-like protein